MNIKSLLLGSAAALVAVSGARAADAVVVAEPEPVEYVRVCDTYGAGFFYIPGTETCLKISGYVRVDVSGGDLWGRNVDADKDVDTYKIRTRATVRFDARSETELGTLRSYIESRFQFDDGADSKDGKTGNIPSAYIELGGFRVGVTDSVFSSWTDAAGKVMQDDLVDYDGDKTNQINYTFAGGNGFSAVIGLEQGDSKHLINDYMPHVVAGVKFEQAWGAISAVGGYDSIVEEFAGKVRLDVKATDQLSLFVMGGYQSGWDDTHIVNGKTLDKGSYYGAWQGDYAVWGGATFKVNEKAKINAQVSYEDEGTIGAAANVAYEIVPGFVITPEIDYVSLDGDRAKAARAAGNSTDQWGGMVRFQRNF